MLAMVFGGLRIAGAVTDAHRLRLAADRAEMVPAITKYMSALDVALLANSTGGDADGAKKNYDARKSELEARLHGTDVDTDVENGINGMLEGGQSLLDSVASNAIGLRARVTSFAPILLTAENAIDASVRVDDEQIRAEAQGLSRAVGARGQMMMQQLLMARGADLPEPELRTSMTTLAGTEPSTLFGMAEVLGVGSPEAKTLQQQMVTRMGLMSDPAQKLVNNPVLLRSVQTTDGIAAQIIDNITPKVTKAVEDQAHDRRNVAIRDSVVVVTAILAAIVLVLLVARSLIRPLRVLRDGALKVAHEDLEREIARVRSGDESPPEPLPVHTTEEIGQVAHAVDELHTQALLLAGDEARLRTLVNDMFETMSRRNRSLVDQQLSLIDRLERNEEDPERLDSLFRLDHLATRMRRNGANLLVLAGAQTTRGDQRTAVPLSSVIHAAASEVEDYRRVETSMVPDCAINGAASGDIVHLLAELIDNALRYSPPASPVRVSAGFRSDGAVLLQIVDVGLGMTDGDRRIANMRLRAGGEVSPDSARHMGLFVVGRLANRHDIRVRLRGSSVEEARSGTTAEVYLPAAVLDGDDAGPAASPDVEPPTASFPVPEPPASPEFPAYPAADASDRDGSQSPDSPISLLPRRRPGSSGITGAPTAPPAQEPAETAEPTPTPPAAQPVSNTSSFFGSRVRFSRENRQASAAEPPQQPEPPETDDVWTAEAAPSAGPPDDDLIYKQMLSEWLVDPHDLAQSPDLDWQTVWDRGWSAAAEAEDAPVEAHTEHGLPVREPGARLVPGGGEPNGNAHHRTDDNGTNGGSASGPTSARGAPVRDPEAVRASMSSHFGGVRAGRSHARDDDQGSE
ncbi:HAMP domain-containing protein [Mycobacterium paraterrae]|uniref:histidine kinase n=2 Tax=Mycobacterium paraterrae TaxID=577492 RepID=A0ABY3VGQ0_9MYCO|nr:ATP-binding protein [Mycobacterium paraterrae]UMB68518.1 HAMP domain-containing protein [Mycobacterium paraterrae]